MSTTTNTTVKHESSDPFVFTMIDKKMEEKGYRYKIALGSNVDPLYAKTLKQAIERCKEWKVSPALSIYDMSKRFIARNPKTDVVYYRMPRPGGTIQGISNMSNVENVKLRLQKVGFDYFVSFSATGVDGFCLQYMVDAGKLS